jgi:hypothetical protein
MPTYSVFGGLLRSEVALPELRAVMSNGAAANWTVRVVSAAQPLASSELLGTDTVMPGVDVRLYRIPNGYRLTYDDTGSFDISRDGREIAWSKGEKPWIEAARLDIINRVLPVALHASGKLCLHGSAVSVHGQGIAFLAPRGYGKSTLAIAMSEIGARILTDDALPVEPHTPVIAWPGVHSVRLMDDAARAVVGDARQLEAVGAYPMTRRDLHQLPEDQPIVTKQILRGLPEERLMRDPVALTAIYLLTPIRPDEQGPAATRMPVAAARAAVALVDNAKSGVLFGKSEAPVLFDRAVGVAREVPIYQLMVARDLERIVEVAEQLTEWHSPSDGRAAP